MLCSNWKGGLTMANKWLRLNCLVPCDAIDFLKEEAARRTAAGESWKWRELAEVRCSVMLQEWVTDQRFRLAEKSRLAETNKHG